MHATVAFTPERVNLGVLGAKLWQRPVRPVGRERKRKPIEEKESYRWLEGYALACEVQQACPQTVVVSVADCEGDIQAWFLDAMGRAGEERAEFLIRAKCNRRRAQGTEPRYLWEAMQRARPLGRITFELSRQADRPSRRVTLSVKAMSVTFNGVRRLGGRLPPVQVWAVYAKELRPPKGEEPIEGLLLTRVSVADFSEACTVVQWYRCRWEIEVCQSQPVKMAWGPLRWLIATIIYLRGRVKREYIRDVYLLSRDDDFFDQTLGNSLAIGKGETIEVLA